MRINQLFVASAGLALVAASLSGCAAQPAPATAPTPTSAPSPSATADATVGPERVFDGDCAELFTADELASAMGVAVSPQATEWDLDPEYVAPVQVGGISCRWGASPDLESVGLSVVVLPAAAAGDGALDPECTEGYGCLFSTAASGFLLSGVLYNPAAPIGQTTAGYETLAAGFASRIAAEPQPAPYGPDGAWSSPVDCAALDAEGLVATAIRAPDATFGPWGGDAEPNYGYVLAATAAATGVCGMSGDESAVTLATQGGGAWIEDSVAGAPGATPVTVPGASGAYVVADRLHVFAGVNRFSLVVAPNQPSDALLAGAAGLLQELDARG